MLVLLSVGTKGYLSMYAPWLACWLLIGTRPAAWVHHLSPCSHAQRGPAEAWGLTATAAPMLRHAYGQAWRQERQALLSAAAGWLWAQLQCLTHWLHSFLGPRPKTAAARALAAAAVRKAGYRLGLTGHRCRVPAGAEGRINDHSTRAGQAQSMRNSCAMSHIGLSIAANAL
jgi:hypothetical protein